MKLIEKLDLSIEQYKRKDRLSNSLAELRRTGRATTGYSTINGTKVWTDKVSERLTLYGIPHQCGNDAPRGGKNGEYIKLISPAMLKIINAERKAEESAWQAKQDAREAKYKEQPQLIADIKGGKYDEIILSKADRYIELYRIGGKQFREYAKRYAKQLDTPCTLDLRDAILRRSCRLTGLYFGIKNYYDNYVRVFFSTQAEAENYCKNRNGTYTTIEL